jgi:PAS domain S-box-containing protein
MDSADTLAQVRHERDRFVAFAFASADILLELDPNGRILFANGATKGLLGREAAQMQGLDFFNLLLPTDSHKARQVLSELDQRHRMNRTEILMRSTQQDIVPFAMTGFRISNLRNHTYLTLRKLTGDDITTDELLTRDVDTGLYKTRNFVENANRRIFEAKERGETLKITMLDMPGLKELLEQLLEADAEKLLHMISDTIRAKSLDGDTAGIIDGGGYSMVHDGSMDPQQLMNDIIELTKNADPKGMGIKVQLNTIEADPGALSPEDSANAMLYTLNQFARKTGEEFRIDSLANSYQHLLNDTVHRISEFKQTLDDEAFQIAFQPIVDLKSGLIHHFEALVRIDSQDTFKNPFEFINFGEQSGIIGDFDLMMCQKVFEVLDTIGKKGFKPVVAVNISGRSLGSMLFRDALRKLVAMNARLRKQVIFEVTESYKIEDMNSVNNFIQELRREGNLCCLDDFGTGDSSFEYLRTLQVDFVKIDGSYVREALKTTRGRHMLKAMAGLCKELEITTIGEMVEDEKEAALLWEAGVKYGQGYLFGKPDTNLDVIKDYKKPTAQYTGVMRAKRFNNRNRAWWSVANG